MNSAAATEMPNTALYDETLLGRTWTAFRNHKGALVGAGILSTIVLAVLIGPFLYGIDPHHIDLTIRNQGPSLSHFLGTDNLGRDMLAQLLAGGQIALAVGLTAMLLSLGD